MIRKLRSLKWFKDTEKSMMENEHTGLGYRYEGYKEAIETVIEEINKNDITDIQKLKDRLIGNE